MVYQNDHISNHFFIMDFHMSLRLSLLLFRFTRRRRFIRIEVHVAVIQVTSYAELDHIGHLPIIRLASLGFVV